MKPIPADGAVTSVELTGPYTKLCPFTGKRDYGTWEADLEIKGTSVEIESVQRWIDRTLTDDPISHESAAGELAFALHDKTRAFVRVTLRQQGEAGVSSVVTATAPIRA